jgi:hypothetical protein
MATVQQFEDLHVWQDARALVREVYHIDEKTFDELREAALALSRRLAKFIDYLNTVRSNSRRRSRQPA